MKAKIIANRHYEIAKIDPRLYGAFLEHLGRAIYTGIYEPQHPTADENGFRKDVSSLVRELNIPCVRYPGGNFVSAYNWEDGIGPVAERPTRLDLAWHSSESNQVGIHEFAQWCKTVDTQMMLAVNLGSRGLDEARNFLEYVNGPTGSYWGDLRRKNGHAEPFDVKLWCLGNEMDGPWQIGQKTADEYGRVAFETAKAMRSFDKSLELVVCGSSHPDMKTYPEWERRVLEHTYESIDYISLHMYSNNRAKNTANYLATNQKLDNYISTVQSTINLVKANKRSKHDVAISFDEWNVWYHSREQDRDILEGKHGWPHAPRLLEDIYIFEDVLQVACIINTFIRRSDIVKIACIAQLVNVIAPIMTEPNGPAWKQSTYYPFYFASLYGRGTALNLVVNCPGYDAEIADNVPYIDVAGVLSSDGNTITLFAVNRHELETADTVIDLQDFGNPSILGYEIMTHENLQASNTLLNPGQVVPRKSSAANTEGTCVYVQLAPLSYSVLRIAVENRKPTSATAAKPAPARNVAVGL
jgi:alpha-N-arabinofuranosidase